jgi:hypothetical protein
MTRRALFATIASLAGLRLWPGLIARWKRRQARREWDRLLAYGRARMRARLKAEGLDLDCMTEDEVMDYVDRVIHEYREEKYQPECSTSPPLPSVG